MNQDKVLADSRIILEEISLVFRYIDPKDRYPMHNGGRRHHGLLYVLEGNEIYRSARATLKTEPGDIIYLPKTEVYDVTMSDPQCTVLCIDFETVYPLGFAPFLIRSGNTRLLRNRFFEAERIWQMKRTGWNAECMAVTYRILSELQRIASMKYCPSEKLERIAPGVDYLHQHFNDSTVSVERLAALCGFHPRYFAKVFNEVYGISPKKYITQLRMDRARELILSNRYSVSQISQLTGYSDIYHFSKVFKQENGVSPAGYEHAGKEG